MQLRTVSVFKMCMNEQVVARKLNNVLFFGKDRNMKVQTQGKEVKAIAIPFRALMGRMVTPSPVVPWRGKTAVMVLAPSLHIAELERQRRQEEMERRERERELRRRREMQQAVHSVD
jgi:hypothetical protein